jgi:hypothetical protein
MTWQFMRCITNVSAFHLAKVKCQD